MRRGKEWQSCVVPLVWIEFTADIIEHPSEICCYLTYPKSSGEAEKRELGLQSYGFPMHLSPERVQKAIGEESRLVESVNPLPRAAVPLEEPEDKCMCVYIYTL